MTIFYSALALAIPVLAWFIMGIVLDFVCPRNVPVIPPEHGIK